jgi:Uma2 family endonuclease
MAAKKTLMTAHELLYMPDDDMRHELVKGELRTMPPAGGLHGSIAMRLGRRVGTHVEAHDLGEVFGAETGFYLERGPDTVRAPDLAFVAAGRLPGGRLPVGYVELVPDLVVEVVSTQSQADAEAKVQMWLEAGVRLVWSLHAASKSARIYRPGREVRVLTSDDELDGEDVLPGFRCRVGDLFPR